MKKYRITLPNNMSVVIEAYNLEEAQKRFKENYPTITNYSITT